MTRVFLSSTFTDLTAYRSSVQQGLRQLGAIDISMEHFGARDERPLEECKRVIEKESDLFVGIYAHRYGFIPDGEKIAITEIEYNTATAISIPRFIYILNENQEWKPAFIDSGTKKKKLDTFKSALLKRHICQDFASQDQLATKVVADIGRHIAMQKVPMVNPAPVNDIGIDSQYNPADETSDEWNNRRDSIKIENRNIFLTHIIRPSTKPNQKFDVTIYLIRQKSDDFADVELAEFFLGRYWGNNVFPARENNGFIGISTSAYGTFLCICRVTFKDGSQVYLNRYIDFESQRTGGAGTF